MRPWDSPRVRKCGVPAPGVRKKSRTCSRLFPDLRVFRKRCFWKTVFLSPTENTRGFDEKWRKQRFAFYPRKKRGCAPRSPETDKNDENGGCPLDKTTVCQKHIVFATLMNRVFRNSWRVWGRRPRETFQTFSGLFVPWYYHRIFLERCP